MRLTRIVVAALLLAGLATAARAESAEERGHRIAREASAASAGYRDYTASGRMILRNAAGASGERRFDFMALEGAEGTDRTLLIFRWPGDIRDTALLTHGRGGQNSDQWLYLPADSRVKRISSSGASGSFVGSEFSYEDMTVPGVERFSYRWVATQSCPGAGGSCEVIDRFPRFGSAYARQRVWLDGSAYRVYRVDFYDRNGTLVKVMTASGYRQYGGRFWRASNIRMANQISGKTTDLTWSDYRFGVGLSPSQFTVNALTSLN